MVNAKCHFQVQILLKKKGIMILFSNIWVILWFYERPAMLAALVWDTLTKKFPCPEMDIIIKIHNFHPIIMKLADWPFLSFKTEFQPVFFSLLIHRAVYQFCTLVCLIEAHGLSLFLGKKFLLCRLIKDLCVFKKIHDSCFLKFFRHINKDYA